VVRVGVALGAVRGDRRRQRPASPAPPAAPGRSCGAGRRVHPVGVGAPGPVVPLLEQPAGVGAGGVAPVEDAQRGLPHRRHDADHLGAGVQPRSCAALTIAAALASCSPANPATGPSGTAAGVDADRGPGRRALGRRRRLRGHPGAPPADPEHREDGTRRRPAARASPRVPAHPVNGRRDPGTSPATGPARPAGGQLDAQLLVDRRDARDGQQRSGRASAGAWPVITPSVPRTRSTSMPESRSAEATASSSVRCPSSTVTLKRDSGDTMAGG
jgi:hypothetical protein